MSNSRNERFRVISVNDPAIDTERMPIDVMTQYMESRDEKLIAPYLRPGSSPTWFHIREIPRRLMTTFVKHALDRHAAAFRCAVVAVENLHQEDNVVLVNFKPPVDQDDVIPEKTLEERLFAECEIDEIGAVAWTHSFLARRMRRIYQVPHTSRVALSVRAFLPAVANQSSPATSSVEVSPAEEAQPSAPAETETVSRSSADASASPTAVTATGTPFEVA